MTASAAFRCYLHSLGLAPEVEIRLLELATAAACALAMAMRERVG